MNKKTKDDGGPAFPVPPEAVIGNGWGSLVVLNEYGLGPTSGMSLRDWFAGKAMQAIVSHQQHGNCEMTSQEELAWTAYEIADAMLKARLQ